MRHSNLRRLLGSERDRLALHRGIFERVAEPDLYESLSEFFLSSFGGSQASFRYIENGHIAGGYATNFDQQAMDAYLAHFERINPIMPLAEKAMLVKPVVQTAEVIADRDYLASEYYQDHVRKLDIFYEVGALFPAQSGSSVNVCLSFSRDHGALSTQAMALIEQVITSVRGAFALRQRIASLEAEPEAPSILLRYNREIGSALPPLFEFLASIGALSPRGSLTFTDQTLNVWLAEQTRSAGSNHRFIDARPMLLDTGGCRFSLRTRPDPASDSVRLYADLSSVPSTLLVDFLLTEAALTRAEAQIALAIWRGEATSTIARSRVTKISTVRTQIKRVLAKTSTNNRAQLRTLIDTRLSVFSRPTGLETRP